MDAPLSKRQRLLRACRCQPVDRPPLWLMRQAGRALPEYRALRERYSFLDLVQTPELAAEVTLQPLRRFGFDAAIVFSDILVVPEALGQPYQFRETGGIDLAFAVRQENAVQRLNFAGAAERLAYVAQALRLLRQELGTHTALLGFAGSPWTLANFMVEGGSAKAFTHARQWWHSDRATFEAFLAHLSEAVAAYLQLQIDAGVDAVQLFDSLGGLLTEDEYEAASGRWLRQIIQSLHAQVPVIVFGRAIPRPWKTLAATGAQVISYDHGMRLAEVRPLTPASVAIQGNLDPATLTTTPTQVARAATALLRDLQGRRGYIFNLGHGLPPAAHLDNIAQLVETVTGFAWEN